MKCISKKLYLTLVSLGIITLISGCSSEKAIEEMYEYETKEFNNVYHEGDLFATNLVVADNDKALTDYEVDVTTTDIPKNDKLYYAGSLFNITDNEQYFGDEVFEKLYPASTTKIITAYVALQNGNLDDVVTVSDIVNTIPADSSICGLEEGDQLTLYDLIAGLVVKSGNDNGVVIAEHISGSVEAFVELMNEEAYRIGATQSNFQNPHGYHDDDHYTTAYDLYLIFNEALKDERFKELIAAEKYAATITKDNGDAEEVTWFVTNQYKKGIVESPDNVEIVGGKTGYTSLARNCLVLLERDANNNEYISIILGAQNATVLYNEMTNLIEAIPTE